MRMKVQYRASVDYWVEVEIDDDLTDPDDIETAARDAADDKFNGGRLQNRLEELDLDPGTFEQVDGADAVERV